MDGERKSVTLLGVPMDLGGGLRGVDMGPSAVRIAGVGARIEQLGHAFADFGNVPVLRPEGHDPKNPRARYLGLIAHCCERLMRRVQRIVEQGDFPLVVGGDHSIAVGTVAGISNHLASRGQKLGMIWFDAHADMNTPETTPTGNVHGMPLACCLGNGPSELVGLGDRQPLVAPENTVLIGIRDLDDLERATVRASGVKAFSMREIDILGMHVVMQEALGIACHGTAGFHLSFDLDGCDPAAAPGVGTPVPGGVTAREAHLLLENAWDSGKLLGLEMTEINPILDDRNMTAELAVQLILSGLGKRIV